MRILVAPDKFKDSLSAFEVSKAIEAGIKEYDHSIEVVCHPMADGGEGTIDILSDILDLETVPVEVNDPLFRPIHGYYKRKKDTAYIEMSKASGLSLLKEEERNCLYTSTIGTGEFILHAIKKGVKTIYLFVGGSATNDAGMGMAHALGYQFLDSKEKAVKPIGMALNEVRRIESTALKVDISAVSFFVVCDVDNPLYGKNGAAQVYAKQKGADTKAIKLLDDGLKNISQVIFDCFNKNVSNIKGSGAAGGIGAGALSFLGAKILPGFQTIIGLTGLKKMIPSFDLIITGEGSIDKQTLQGKVVKGICDEAEKNNITAAAICGVNKLEEKDMDKIGVKKIVSLVSDEVSTSQAMKYPNKYVQLSAIKLLKELSI